jgi:hypothetical protein
MEPPSDCKCKIKEGNIMYHRTPLIWNKWHGEPSGYAENLDDWIPPHPPKIGYIGSLGCYCLQDVLVFKPLDHAWLEVLEAITLYCT